MKKILLIILLVYTAVGTCNEDVAQAIALQVKERSVGGAFLCWQLLFICMWYLLYWSLYKKKSMMCTLVLVLCLLLTGMPIIQGYYRMSEQWGITSFKTPIYIGPHKSYPVRAELDSLSDVRIIKKENMWYHIASTAGRGWLPADAVALIA